MAAFVGDSVRVIAGDEPVAIRGAAVSGDFFWTLGAQPVAGRGFVPEEQHMGAPKVIVLSDGFRQRLGGDKVQVGTTVRLDREVFMVVGIMPRGFTFPAGAEFWTPFATDDPRNDPGNHSLRVIGRLKAGVSVAQAQTEIATIAKRLELAHPEFNNAACAAVLSGEASCAPSFCSLSSRRRWPNARRTSRSSRRLPSNPEIRTRPNRLCTLTRVAS